MVPRWVRWQEVGTAGLLSPGQLQMGVSIAEAFSRMMKARLNLLLLHKRQGRIGVVSESFLNQTASC